MTARNKTILLKTHARLVVGTAIAALTLGGYGNHSAYAGGCSPTGGGTYSCSGAANAAADTSQIINIATPLTVTTDPGFGIDSSGTTAIILNSNGELTFTDNNGSAITGTSTGISATNNGAGAVNITATGQVTGTSGTGITARNNNSTNGTDITISAAAVSAGAVGIAATNLGSGDLSITTSGQVTTNTGNGIQAANGGNDLIISTAAVTGGNRGISALNFSSGALSVTASGLVEGVTRRGILASNASGTTNLSILAASVSGAVDGVFVRNKGSGETSVITTGQVTGTSGSGINATNYGNTIGLTISATDVTGRNSGIFATNRGSGVLSVTTTGQVNTTSSGVGISVFNVATGTDLIVSAADVTGTNGGISAQNQGSGTTSVTVNGIINGGLGIGILARTIAGQQSNITLNSGAAVSSTTAAAIGNGQGNSATVVNAGASVTGAISLSTGSDNLTFNGGDFSGVTLFDGGDDTSAADGFVDVLTFQNVAGDVVAANAVNWETVALGAGANISFGDGILDTALLDVGAGASLATNIFSDTLFDVLDVSGDVDFAVGSLIDFDLSAVSDFSLFDGLSLTFLNAGGSVSGFGNLGFNFTGLSALFAATVQLNGVNSLSVNFSNVSVVPLPASFYLFGSALAGMAGIASLRRRRRRKAVAV